MSDFTEIYPEERCVVCDKLIGTKFLLFEDFINHDWPKTEYFCSWKCFTNPTTWRNSNEY
jgi:hypothetical protein